MSRFALRDTLFTRLFALLWCSMLLASMLGPLTVANLLPRGMPGPAFGPAPGPVATPAGPPGPVDAAPRGFGGPPGPPRRPPFGRPLPILLIDLLMQTLVTGLAAWIGARWLVQPMQRFARAAQALGQSLEAGALETGHGPREVREASVVFNEMRDRLRAQFAERSQFIAAVSHDLRTPLTRLRLRLEAFDGQPQAERCRADIAEMNQMIDSVLGFLREESDTEVFQQMDLKLLVQVMVDDLVELGKPVVFEGEPAVMQLQPMAMRRCLSNLLENAIRYGVRANVRLWHERGHMMLAIDDEGPGIPAEQHAEVLRPFVRIEKSRNRGTGGVGLGLAIAREIAQRHGAALRLGRSPADGLRVLLVFAAASQRRPDTTPAR